MGDYFINTQKWKDFFAIFCKQYITPSTYNVDLSFLITCSRSKCYDAVMFILKNFIQDEQINHQNYIRTLLCFKDSIIYDICKFILNSPTSFPSWFQVLLKPKTTTDISPIEYTAGWLFTTRTFFISTSNLSQLLQGDLEFITNIKNISIFLWKDVSIKPFQKNDYLDPTFIVDFLNQNISNIDTDYEIYDTLLGMCTCQSSLQYTLIRDILNDYKAVTEEEKQLISNVKDKKDYSSMLMFTKHYIDLYIIAKKPTYKIKNCQQSDTTGFGSTFQKDYISVDMFVKYYNFNPSITPALFLQGPFSSFLQITVLNDILDNYSGDFTYLIAALTTQDTNLSHQFGDVFTLDKTSYGLVKDFRELILFNMDNIITFFKGINQYLSSIDKDKFEHFKTILTKLMKGSILKYFSLSTSNIKTISDFFNNKDNKKGIDNLNKFYQEIIDPKTVAFFSAETYKQYFYCDGKGVCSLYTKGDCTKNQPNCYLNDRTCENNCISVTKYACIDGTCQYIDPSECGKNISCYDSNLCDKKCDINYACRETRIGKKRCEPIYDASDCGSLGGCIKNDPLCQKKCPNFSMYICGDDEKCKEVSICPPGSNCLTSLSDCEKICTPKSNSNIAEKPKSYIWVVITFGVLGIIILIIVFLIRKKKRL